MTALLNSPAWPIVGMLIGALATIAVPLINKRPNRQQLGQTAFDQLSELAEMYREDLETYRDRAAEGIKVEGALRAELQEAAKQITSLRDELGAARAEIRALRADAEQITGLRDELGAAQAEIRALRGELDQLRQ